MTELGDYTVFAKDMVWFPAPISESSQPSLIAVPGNLDTLSHFCKHLHICDAYKLMKAYIHKNLTKFSYTV